MSLELESAKSLKEPVKFRRFVTFLARIRASAGLLLVTGTSLQATK
jgi:hypothetical protein